MLISLPTSTGDSQTAGPHNPAGGEQDLCPAPAPDGELLKRFLTDRDEAAFAQLVSRFGPLVLAVALRHLRDRHAAEDVFQATFLVLARDAKKIRSQGSVGSWIHGTAMRISKKALTRRQREISLERLMHPLSEALPFDGIGEQYQQQLLDEELQRLPHEYRVPLVLHFLEGKTCEETAAALGISVGAVRGRLQRGKQKLKLRLMKRGIEVSSVMVAFMMWQTTAEASLGPHLVTAATNSGMAVVDGTAYPSACSPEAVHLAAKETTMFTAGNVFIASTVLFCSSTLGWFAHSAFGEPQAPPTVPVVAALELIADDSPPAESIVVPLDRALAFDDSTDPKASDSKSEKPVLTLKYGDGKPDGKKSIAGTGKMVRFKLPNNEQKLRTLRVHCARYGYPKAPNEDVEVTIVSDDGTDIIHTEFVPYDTFKRGESRWTTIKFDEPVEVPETFWVILEFNAERTKGVYVSYDSSTKGEHSKTGVPGATPKKVTFEGDWMIQAILTKPEG